MLIRSSITLDHRNHSRPEFDSKINGKPLNLFRDTIISAFAKENGLERDMNGCRKVLLKGECDFNNLQMVSAIL